MTEINSLTDYDDGLGRECDALKGFVKLLQAAFATEHETMCYDDLHLLGVTADVLVKALVNKIDECDGVMRTQLGKGALDTK